MTAQLGVPPAMLAAMTGSSVQVDPYLTSTVWAYQLPWRPVPIFQTYSAYTPLLDRLDAQALTGPDAPQRILRQRVDSVDGRIVAYEAPRYALAELCRYRQQMLTDQWQLLTAAGTDRCGVPRSLGTVTINRGQRVAVPSPSTPDMVVVMSLDLHPSLSDRVATSVFRPLRFQRISLDGASPQRIVAANASGPLLLRVPSYAPVGPGAHGRFDVGTFALPDLTGPARVTFTEIPLAR